MPALRTMRIIALTTALTATLSAAAVSTETATAAPTPITDDRAASCTTGSTADFCAAPDTLLDVRIGDVHPTQPSLGYDEVYYKLGRYSTALSKDAVNKKFDDWCEADGRVEAATVSPGARLDRPSSFTCELPRGAETAESTAPMKTVVIGPEIGRAHV